MFWGNISLGKPKIARVSFLLTADKLHFRNIPFSVSETWTMQQNLTNQVPRHHFLSSVFLTFSHFLLLNLGGLKGRGEVIGSSALGMSLLWFFSSPPHLFIDIGLLLFRTDFFSSCRLPPGLQKWVFVQANSFHFTVWDSQRYTYLSLFAYAYNKNLVNPVE